MTSDGRVDVSAGLTSAEVEVRRLRAGPNRIVPEPRRHGPLQPLTHAVTDPMVLLLALAAIVYATLGDLLDAVVAAIAIVPIALVSVLLESRTDRALAELARLTAPTAAVVRDGSEARVPVLEIVPGDVVRLREGDLVPADGHLLERTELHLDESSLTGESEPVSKGPSEGADRAVLWAGTTVVSGRGTMTVDVTGAATRYGRIGSLLAAGAQPRTPLQEAIGGLFRLFAAIALVVCAAVVGLELARGSAPGDALIAGISLAIAAIPEEIPMVFSLYLGLGAWRLSRDRALVRRLSGVETLGSTTVICTDKTGTLTLGRLTLVEVRAFGGATEADVLHAGLLASEPVAFDPLERSLEAAAEIRRIRRPAAARLLRDHAFDQRRKYLSHVWSIGDRVETYAKGALEGILGLVETDQDGGASVAAEHDALARRGMRVIAVAAGGADRVDRGRAADEGSLRLLGLLGFADPVRDGVADAVHECVRAGIRVVMVTGDHPATALAVALAVGIHPGRGVVTGEELDGMGDDELADVVPHTGVFARIRPEQKVRLVRALRTAGDVVAMTGDGTNDAPALREAHIGIAMGRRGTEVARAAATLVLLDDDFATIVTSVRDGRRIFENLRRALAYLVAFHAPLLILAVAVPLVGAPLLLLPVHLVWLELIVHPTASLVFEGDPAADDLMSRPPRDARRPILGRSELGGPAVRGMVLAVGVLALYLGSISSVGEPAARGLALAALILGQTGLVLTERSPDRALWRARYRGNRYLVPVLLAAPLSLAAVLTVPALGSLLRVESPGAAGWLVAVVVAAVATLCLEPVKHLRGRPHEGSNGPAAPGRTVLSSDGASR